MFTVQQKIIQINEKLVYEAVYTCPMSHIDIYTYYDVGMHIVYEIHVHGTSIKRVNNTVQVRYMYL